MTRAIGYHKPMPDNTKRLIQRQFGANAAGYVTSSTHAQSHSLARLVELVDPQPGWRVLDVATGGGHTALAFAQRTEHIVATDLTHPMLLAALGHSQQQGASHVTFCQSDAEQLPFAANCLDAVVCRTAAHHFPAAAAFVTESARVLKSGGVLALADNMTSGEAKIAQFLNTFEKLRDPSHHWGYSLDDWETFFFTAGLTVSHCETFSKALDFDDWAMRAGVSGDDLTRLRVLLVQAPDSSRAWLLPRKIGSRLLFTLTEGIIVGHKPV